MSGSAQRFEDTGALDFESVEESGTAHAAGESALKQAVAERLAAHRNKRAAERERLADMNARQGSGIPSRRASTKVRDAVAARYEQSQSYREFLAAEAERALEQAQAEAEVAARKARAIADSNQQLMEELEQWDCTATADDRVQEIGRTALQAEQPATITSQQAQARSELAHALADIALGAQELIRERQFEAEQFAAGHKSTRESGGLSVQLYGDFPAMGMPEMARPMLVETGSAEELAALEEEIAFRLAPELGEFAVESQPIPGNLIEFPRQLVAPKRARPRLAEGPLREEAPQLRIFEVDAVQISAEPAAQQTAAPEWQNLKLESTTVAVRSAPLNAQTQFTLQPQTASMERRIMAAAVDGACIGAALVAFVAVTAQVTGRSIQMLSRPLLGASAGGVLLLLYVAYQMLFFSLNGDTPGMRYARIGLCTFGDRNPSRKAMRRRVLATLLAVCPVGLGLLWALLDDEKLGWHDRISRMYQRGY